ncbi:MAG: bifunctional phosphopantothenoylcysteine decarboxylase/phosphopantothenate--cysteine ligase CoaBC [Alphaproteobacteria bacterium]|nr:bifunctional phosphopantothenoylcysteine decarboxylase/phosphopantothenate--cysteine ligase CoaBC [Alphaproteobacteria bacterium]
MTVIAQNLVHRRILLIISGGIAAYKSLDLIRRLRERGADVRCILTSGGAQFITPLSVGALSENKVYTNLFSLTDEQEMGHIRLARDCDLVLVTPASANIMARAAQGLADDLASTVLLATDKPVMMCPAMNPAMWANAATQENIATLKRRGIRFVEPAVGDMACGEHGTGRLPDVPEIVAAVSEFFAVNGPLRGRRAIVTSGPTHESIDPVRFIGNISSGRQGHAIAAALAGAGADVTLISGPVQEPPPAGIHVVRITTAQQMLEATLKALPADIAVFAAAVADYRPAEAAAHKIKKSGDDGISLALVQNPDILRTVATSNHRPALVVGFAAETDAGIEDAKKKLARKGCDWLVLNDVAGGKVFGQADNTVTVLKNSGKDISADSWPHMSKQDVARRLVSEIAEAL